MDIFDFHQPGVLSAAILPALDLALCSNSVGDLQQQLYCDIKVACRSLLVILALHAWPFIVLRATVLGLQAGTEGITQSIRALVLSAVVQDGHAAQGLEV